MTFSRVGSGPNRKEEAVGHALHFFRRFHVRKAADAFENLQPRSGAALLAATGLMRSSSADEDQFVHSLGMVHRKACAARLPNELPSR